MTDKDALVPETTNEREQSTDSLPTNGLVTPEHAEVIKIASELKDLPQWVCYRLCPGKKGKLAKVPFNARTGEPASVADPETWSPFETALQASDHYDGIGFALADGGPYTGIDLDACMRPDGTFEPWARAIIDRLNSYTEITPSGTGLRILIRGSLPPGRRRLNMGEPTEDGGKHPGVEMYDRRRYLTITGRHVNGTSETIEDRDAELKALHAELFPRTRHRHSLGMTTSRPSPWRMTR